MINDRKLAIGILAHVDAGKTTLAESILYHCKAIRKPGRVDHGNAFLDTFALEKARGITIFSKQAMLSLGDKSVTLLDTPGHVDFSAEMERTLQVLDYAILVISGMDGVQGHVLTLWKLLKRYQVPVFLFINKMDQPGTDRDALMTELTKRLDEHCILFDENREDDMFFENLAVCDEKLLEQYLETGELTDQDISSLIRKRQVFPCYFGSALKMQGVDAFLRGIERFAVAPSYRDTFAARVYKIARDAQGNRLTYMKITGGTLKVKQTLSNRQNQEPGEEIWEEKADQIRLYSGVQFQLAKEVSAGSVCAVTGLEHTYVGQGLGAEKAAGRPELEPVLTYKIELPPQCDVHGMYTKLCYLEEEEPLLHIVWEEETNEIHAKVMGVVQMEILRSMIKERYGVEVEFGAGSIVYKETILEPMEGVGHFEPLRHYAEVHLLLEPGERGSGLVFDTVCSEDVLDKNWQRLIMTHLEEKVHRGVLTGSEITDMKITLMTGRAHQKHTEGGDFRQATYRAVRHGLKRAKSLLLEPVYEFVLEIPADTVGRAMTDIQKMQGSFSQPEIEGDTAVIRGSAPVVTMRDYQRDVIAYTRGEGRLFCSLRGYEPCHNAEEVIAASGYDSEHDLLNPTGSVFCAHGAGFPVSWEEVTSYMHLESNWEEWLRRRKQGVTYANLQREERMKIASVSSGQKAAGKGTIRTSLEQDKELEEIFTRTYGPVRQTRTAFMPVKQDKKISEVQEAAKDYLLVDGYNIIFAWEELRELAKTDITAARLALMDILSNYQGYRGNVVILVFDAYKVEGYQGEVQKYHNIYVVYTKEAETADQYIEKTVVQMERNKRVTVATSDGIEQLIIMGQGALRMSAKGLEDEILAANIEIRKDYLSRTENGRSYLFAGLSKELAEQMEQIRLGKDSGKQKMKNENSGGKR